MIELAHILGRSSARPRLLTDMRAFAEHAQDESVANGFRSVLEMQPDQRRLVFANPAIIAKVHGAVDQLLQESGAAGDLNAAITSRRRALEQMRSEARDQLASLARDSNHLKNMVASVRFSSLRERDAVDRCYRNHLMRAP